MKFTVWSDLHAEINGFILGLDDVAGGDVLILAGDIFSAGQVQHHELSDRTIRLAEILCRKVFPRFKEVIYVFGNHEHYHSKISESAKFIREWLLSLGARNLTILEDEWVAVDEVVIYGCTLWTELSNGLDRDVVERGLNDYRLIKLYDREELPDMPLEQRITHNAFGAITGAYTHGLHTDSLAKLEAFLEKKAIDPFLAPKTLVVVTHHAPSKRSINTEHSGNGLDPAFASDLEDFIRAHPEIKVWVHGHTHMNFDYQVGQTRIFANQYGYYFEGQKRKFDVNGGFET